MYQVTIPNIFGVHRPTVTTLRFTTRPVLDLDSAQESTSVDSSVDWVGAVGDGDPIGSAAPFS